MDLGGGIWSGERVQLRRRDNAGLAAEEGEGDYYIGGRRERRDLGGDDDEAVAGDVANELGVEGVVEEVAVEEEKHGEVTCVGRGGDQQRLWRRAGGGGGGAGLEVEQPHLVVS